MGKAEKQRTDPQRIAMQAKRCLLVVPQQKQKRKETGQNQRQIGRQIEQQNFLCGVRIGQNGPFAKRPVGVSVYN